jgi:hypothetical protein
VKTDELKRYHTTLHLTNAHLQEYKPGVTRRPRADPSSESLFQICFLTHSGLAELSYHYANIGRVTDMAGNLYFDSKRRSDFSTLKGLHAAARGRTARELRAWLEA